MSWFLGRKVDLGLVVMIVGTAAAIVTENALAAV
jgi:hypothetical protein